MLDRLKVMKGLIACSTPWDNCDACPYFDPMKASGCSSAMMGDALALLQEQVEEQKRLVNWLGKFCSHVDQHFQPLPDEQNIEFFRQKMKQQFGWEVSRW